MPQYLTPGVYIEEIAGPKPIQAVGTATGAFVGIAERGPIGEAKLITNWTQFVDIFGGFIPAGYLAYAVKQFFDEGGTTCYVVRTCSYNYASIPAKHRADTGTITLNDTAAAATLKIDALSPGSWSDHLWVEIAEAKKDPTNKFRLVVYYKGREAEPPFEELTKTNVLGMINGVSKFIRVSHAGVSILAPARSARAIDDRGTPAAPTLALTALDRGLNLAIAHQSATQFALLVTQAGLIVDRLVNLSMADVERKVNGISSFITARNLHPDTNNPPATTSVLLDDRAAAPLPTLSVTALASGLTLDVENGTAANTFRLVVKRGATTLETFDDLTPGTAGERINGTSATIQVWNLGSATAAPNNLPATTAASVNLPAPLSLNFFALTGGDDGLANGVTLDDAGGADSLNVYAYRDQVQVKVDNATSGAARFKITVLVNAAEVEVFDELVMDTVESIINGSSQFIEVAVVAGADRPANVGNTAVPTGLADADFIGDEATKNGLHAFDPVDDINIVAIPDRPGDREVILAAYTYCQNRKDCFFVADSPVGLNPQQVLAFKQGTGTFAGNAFNSSYAALYYPWIMVADPVTGRNKLVPPSGAVAGTYSSTDVVRGVHKAPAGTIDGYLNSAVGIEVLITKGEQGLLNPEHVNVIRSFPGAGIVIWGARTLSADPEWRYVNVRRLLLFIEESIDKGSQWVVFEPNDPSLWARLKRDITAFLTMVWRSGALFGLTADEAFYVKIDTENNPPEVRDAGQLIIDIGVAPVKPAEFVIFRITQFTPAK